jgi:hypothetical protein
MLMLSLEYVQHPGIFVRTFPPGDQWWLTYATAAIVERLTRILLDVSLDGQFLSTGG